MSIKERLAAHPSHTVNSSGAWETIDTATILEFIQAWGSKTRRHEEWDLETLTIERGSIQVIFLLTAQEFRMESYFGTEQISFVEASAILGAEIWTMKEANRARTRPLN